MVCGGVLFISQVGNGLKDPGEKGPCGLWLIHTKGERGQAAGACPRAGTGRARPGNRTPLGRRRQGARPILGPQYPQCPPLTPGACCLTHDTLLSSV